MMKPAVTMDQGIFYKDGKPIFFISGDYPYYRDDPSDWGIKLDQIKAMGIDTISSYIPWRHHASKQPSGEIKYDFDGSTYPSRNVIKFIELVKEKCMFLIVKPGPFIHAETTYGGLPDFVCPKENKEIIPSRNAWGYANKWSFMFGRPLPSPLEEPYVSMVKDFMEHVGQHVFKNHVYPAGPIIAIQVLNEGIFSQGNITLDNFEYSPIGKKLFNDYLREKYKDSIDAFNDSHAQKIASFGDIAIPKPADKRKIASLKALKIIVEWGDFATTYYNAVMRAYLSGIYHGSQDEAKALPVMINTNPPSNFKQGADTFLVRMVPELMTAHYGYTNWIGVVPYRDDSWYRYALMIKRYKGVNLEENWGFSDYYDPIYQHGHVSYYQTLLAIAFGTTGFNVYTAAKTRAWPPELDHHTEPYPKAAPITESGQRTEKCDLIEFFTATFTGEEGFGAELVNATSPSVVYYGIYNSYATLHSWIGNEPKRWSKLGFTTPPSVAEHGLASLHLALEHLGFDYTPVNLEDHSSRMASIKPGNVLVIVASQYLSADVQNFLVTFVNARGHVVIAGTVPTLDENFSPCNIIQDVIKTSKHLEDRELRDDLHRQFTMHVLQPHEHSGKIILFDGNPFARVADKNELKFHKILKFLQFIIPFNFLKQIPPANAEGELGSRLTWMKSRYTQHALAFSAPIVNTLASLLGFKPYIRYDDNLVQLEPVDVHGQGVNGVEVALATRKYKVLVRRLLDENLEKKRTDFVFIFSRSDEALDVHFSLLDHPSTGHVIPISMNLPPRSAHALMLRDGSLDAFLLNGRVSFNNTASKMTLRVGNDVVATESAIDIQGMKKNDNSYRIRVAYAGAELVYVTINSMRLGPLKNAPA